MHAHKFLFFAAIIATAATAGAQAPAGDPGGKFETLVAAASKPSQWTVTKQDPQSGKWTKRHFEISHIKYDVKTTDSILTPIVGLVSFDASMRVAGSAASETEAEALPPPTRDSLGMDYSVNGRYAFKESGWKLTDFTYRSTSPGLRDPLIMTAETLSKGRTSTISEILYRWKP